MLLSNSRLTFTSGIPAVKPTTKSRPSLARQRRLSAEAFPADRVEDAIDALPAGELLDPLLEVETDYYLVGAGRPGRRFLVSAGDDGDDSGSERLRNLRRGDADSTRRARYQQGFARLKLCALRKSEALSSGSSLAGRPPAGRSAGPGAGKTMFGLHDTLLGKLPQPQNPTTRLLGTKTGLDTDDARYFGSRDEGELGLDLILTPGLQHVGKVDSHRVDIDHDLAGSVVWALGGPRSLDSYLWSVERGYLNCVDGVEGPPPRRWLAFRRG